MHPLGLNIYLLFVPTVSDRVVVYFNIFIFIYIETVFIPKFLNTHNILLKLEIRQVLFHMGIR